MRPLGSALGVPKIGKLRGVSTSVRPERRPGRVDPPQHVAPTAADEQEGPLRPAREGKVGAVAGWANAQLGVALGSPLATPTWNVLPSPIAAIVWLPTTAIALSTAVTFGASCASASL